MNTRSLSRTIIATALVAVTAVAQASPRYPHESTVRARVISSEPVYETINEPRTQCWTETVGHDHYRHEGSGGAVIGAIAGGLLGSTIGKGNGRVAAAAVGAATGAVIGDRMDPPRYTESPRQIERCQTTDNRRRIIAGYDVRYRYMGQDYSTRLPYEPGRHLNLRVSVAVDEDSHRSDRYDDRDDR